SDAVLRAVSVRLRGVADPVAAHRAVGRQDALVTDLGGAGREGYDGQVKEAEAHVTLPANSLVWRLTSSGVPPKDSPYGDPYHRRLHQLRRLRARMPERGDQRGRGDLRHRSGALH